MGSASHAHAADGLRPRKLCLMEKVFREIAVGFADPCARPSGRQAGIEAGAYRRSGINNQDPQTIRDAGHVARGIGSRSSQDPEHCHEPDRSEIGLRRRRRGSGAFRARPERGQSVRADQAGRERPFRRDGGVSQPLRRARDQDRAGREAGRGRAIARNEGDRLDCPIASFDEGRFH